MGSGSVLMARVLHRKCWVLPLVWWAQGVWLSYFQMIEWIDRSRGLAGDRPLRCHSPIYLCHGRVGAGDLPMSVRSLMRGGRIPVKCGSSVPLHVGQGVLHRGPGRVGK